MLPENGKGFPRSSSTLSEADYVAGISRALKSELGSTRVAAKTIMRWTGASDHTARNWLNGVVGPSGRHLLCLSQRSSAVLATVLEMTGRPELLLMADIHAIEVALAKASGAFAVLARQRATSPPRSF